MWCKWVWSSREGEGEHLAEDMGVVQVGVTGCLLTWMLPPLPLPLLSPPAPPFLFPSPPFLFPSPPFLFPSPPFLFPSPPFLLPPLPLQLANAGDDVLLFYNDQAFSTLLQLMKVEEGDGMGDLAYHLNLVTLLTLCTEGKNVATEIKCHSLLPLEELVRVVCHPECIPDVSGCGLGSCDTIALLVAFKAFWNLVMSFIGTSLPPVSKSHV